MRRTVWAAVIEEHALPEDVVLAGRVSQALRESQASEADQATASIVETLRLRWGIQRLPFQQALAVHYSRYAHEQNVALALGMWDVGAGCDGVV